MRYFLVSIILLIAGCDVLEPDSFEERYVVESYQVGGASLGTVRLSRTADVGTAYDFSELAVSGAEVFVDLLGEDGSVEETYPYVEHVSADGIYVAGSYDVVQPLRTYRLRALVPDTETLITAQTIVPDTFSLAHATADTVVYQSDDPLRLRVTRSAYPGRQSVFIFSTEAIGALSMDRLTPFVRRVVEEMDDPILENLRRGSSPILNEANYEVHADSTVTIPLTWVAVSWYGDLRISATALDDNLYDFIRSSTVQQQGGATLSPGEIPAVLSHVDGAAGVFGSYTRVGYDVHVKRAE